ncbi:MAG: flagellar biosynthesis anti-sigma factor FlgM [Mariprofundaceae bacterium]
MVRIEKSGSPAAAGPTGSTKRKQSSKSKSASSGGKVSVADATSLREKAKIMLSDTPDVRIKRVEEIRNALEEGSYEINEQNVAAHIVINALTEKPW